MNAQSDLRGKVTERRRRRWFSFERDLVCSGARAAVATWKNKNDDRVCPADATVWSIYCAMEKATIEVTGAFHHTRPALDVVRDVIEQRSAGRNYQHLLKDYNNDPRTHLSDVQSLFKEALEHMHDWHWLLTHHFS